MKNGVSVFHLAFLLSESIGEGMRKYIILWFVTGFVSELAIFFYGLSDREILANLWSNTAYFFNPYYLIYMGYETYSENYWISFGIMHSARLVWLLLAGFLDSWSKKYKLARYVTWGMLVVYFIPYLIALNSM